MNTDTIISVLERILSDREGYEVVFPKWREVSEDSAGNQCREDWSTISSVD